MNYSYDDLNHIAQSALDIMKTTWFNASTGLCTRALSSPMPR